MRSIIRFSFVASVVLAGAVGCVGWHSGEVGGFPNLASSSPTRPLVLFVRDGALVPLPLETEAHCATHRCSPSRGHPSGRVLPIDLGGAAKDELSHALAEEGHFRLADDASNYRLRVQLADAFTVSHDDAKWLETSMLTLGVFPFVERHPLTITAMLESPDGTPIASRTAHEDYTVMMELLALPALPLGASLPNPDAKRLWHEVGLDLARWASFEADRYERGTPSFPGHSAPP